MTGDLVQFLRERLAETEARAKKDIWAADNATGGNWRAHYGQNLPYSLIKAGDSVVMRIESDQHQADALLAARFKPETVRARATQALAEVNGKRRIIDHVVEQIDRIDHPWWFEDSVLPILQLFAMPYRDHPDYRSEWAPEG